MNKNIKIVSNIIFIIIIVLLVGYYILRLTNKVEIYTVMTGSMEDNINAGDYILIYKKNDYKVGDIVTFRENEFYITHRIIKKDNDTYITKGDANNTEDSAISKDKIIGKVLFSGGLLNFIINYKYLLVGVLLILYLISCYLNKKVEKE